MKKKLFFVVNVDWFFLSHRLPIALEAIRRGYDVYLLTKDTGKRQIVESYGIKFIEIPFERSKTNPLKEVFLILKLRSVYLEHMPDIIHHITLKPSIYGTIASKSIEKPVKVVNAVSGLGYSFTDDRKSVGKVILIKLLKLAFKAKATNFIFQNPDDKEVYGQLDFLTPSNNVIIKGSGVDENEFTYTPPIKKDRLYITMLSRMLKDKGVMEFIDAANILRAQYEGQIKFILVGGIDLENPAHIKEAELNALCDGEYLDWQGFRTDVKHIYQQSDITCLPSYREGLPKSLIEAMAIGRPIVTTNAIGCKECVDDRLNGFLVPVKSSKILAEKLKLLIDDAQLRINMGLKSREKMVKEMSLAHVISETFKIYE
ncbi:glycosyltransferase family 1 protein [Pedobacter yonginense]|uniref:Glycosyltransferase family 1 protein n=1 Tax=Pedobacter yonginense TaxID=651869 RepID=A0A317ENQ5_9SPHI|nr:glycosyltransferase family 4 protein [Pedobacter yonginense]PWS28192.1 glycosyltransferase family 1 protein [Pedobacter yonginense]